jgi:hypothetical protein
MLLHRRSAQISWYPLGIPCTALALGVKRARRRPGRRLQLGDYTDGCIFHGRTDLSHLRPFNAARTATRGRRPCGWAETFVKQMH